ncbi:PREDICTED: uncharacterized protein LOC106106454 [Papilio polytes]|uniref:uncharacterized protein LOC106106454 n=1 Tax=Papilio polytes TaxID=76194 RepID=UPI0006763CD6|nr:PREDICTED: uncharacterized protein LOC106106454 [Papilio polytes]
MRTVLTLLLLAAVVYSQNINNAVETEMFAVPITPNLFNWTYQVLIVVKIHPKDNMARHEVELKIDNLNVEDLLDDHRMTRLKDILRMKLWTESKEDLYPTFLSSAIDLGARLPLKPSDGEGYNTIYKPRSTVHVEYLTELPNSSRISSTRVLDRQTDPESEYFLENIYHICIDYRKKRAHKSGRVELCRYGTGNTEQTQADNNSNKSLGVSPNNSLVRPYSPKSSTNLAGNYNRPQPPPYIGSTTNSLHHRRSGNTTTPSTSGHSPDHNRTLALEESLKLLNEANITNYDTPKDPIIDLNDGTEDYVLVKPDFIQSKPDITGYNSIKPDLDDINVPELAKYGVTGIGGI